MVSSFAKRLLASLFMLCLTSLLLMLFIPSFLCILFPDDAFYYFEIAHNLTLGLGSTFDGINPTNGYHPLWLITIYPLAKFFRSPDVMAFSVFGIQIILTGLGGAILATLFSGMEKPLKFFWLAFGLVFLNPILFSVVINGLESALYFFFILLGVWVLKRLEEKGRESVFDWFVSGLVFGLIFLARLDGGIFAICVLFMFLIEKEKLSHRLKKCLFFGFGFLILALPYISYNWIFFGHPVPISGRIKSLHGSQNPIYLITLSIFFLSSLTLIIYWQVKSRGKINNFPKVLFPFLEFCLGIIFYYLLSPLYMLVLWYYLPILIVGIFALALLLRWLWKQKQMFFKVIASALVLAGIAGIIIGFLFCRYSQSQSVYRLQEQVIKFIQENIPESALLSSPGGGAVAFFTKRKTVNLDGLVNSPEYYFKYYRKGKTGEFLRKMQVDYLVRYNKGPLPNNLFGIEMKPVFAVKDFYRGPATFFKKTEIYYYVFKTEFCKHPPKSERNQ